MANRMYVVTGGAGFVGSRLALRLEKEFPDDRVIVVDDFSSGRFENLKGFTGSVITADISDIKKLMTVLAPNDAVDCVFHNAAITDTTVHDQAKMMTVNTETVRYMSGFAEQCGAKLIYASSSAVYGQHPHEPMVVGKHEEPLNIYAFSKMIADNLLLPCNTVGLRYFNVYGPGEQYKGKAASMVYRLYRQMCGYFEDSFRPAGGPVQLFKGSGDMKRDWIHVDDVVNANLAAMNCETGGIYNVGSGKPASFLQVVKMLATVMGVKNPDVEWIQNKTPQFYQQFTHADIKETRKNLVGFEPRSPAVGVGEYVVWLKDQENGR